MSDQEIQVRGSMVLAERFGLEVGSTVSDEEAQRVVTEAMNDSRPGDAILVADGSGKNRSHAERATY